MMKRKLIIQEFHKILKRSSVFRQPGEVLPDVEHDPRSMKRVFPVYSELMRDWAQEEWTGDRELWGGKLQDPVHENLEVWKYLAWLKDPQGPQPAQELAESAEEFLANKKKMYNNMWGRHFMHNWKPADFALLVKLIEDTPTDWNKIPEKVRAPIEKQIREAPEEIMELPGAQPAKGKWYDVTHDAPSFSQTTEEELEEYESPWAEKTAKLAVLFEKLVKS